MSPAQAMFATTIRQLEAELKGLGSLVPRPGLVDLGGRPHRVWRHKSSDKGALVASYLKCVRIVSSLNACNVLLAADYVQEVYALCRSIDEFGEDVMFLLRDDGGQEPSRDHTRYLNEYFQEEFADVDDLLGSHQDRDRVSRRKVHAMLAKQDDDPTHSQSLQQVLHKTFSGYVHAAYVHTMDLYDGKEYKMSGLNSSRRMSECEWQFASYIYRSIMAVQMVAMSLEQMDVDARLERMRQEFGAKSGCVRSE